MTVDYLLKNGLVIIEGEPERKSVALDLGKIEGIYSPGSEPPARQVIDCEDLYILPGAIDIHVHLRDLDNSDKEDFATGTRASTFAISQGHFIHSETNTCLYEAVRRTWHPASTTS
jgi:dihydroorotase-like cyclic amidohydrolase